MLHVSTARVTDAAVVGMYLGGEAGELPHTPPRVSVFPYFSRPPVAPIVADVTKLPACRSQLRIGHNDHNHCVVSVHC